MNELELKYGCNPNQKPSRIFMEDGNPLPSFEGEPTWINIEDLSIDDFANLVWENLNEDNKVSLFVRYIDIETGKYESRIINKNK